VNAISTEGRVFVAQLQRELAARERAGASLLAPGHVTWASAFQAFARSFAAFGSPVKAAKMFKARLQPLLDHGQKGAYYVNAHGGGSRSGHVEILTFEVAKHPLLNDGPAGILVNDWVCILHRGGRFMKAHCKAAFISWHALARARERSELDQLTIDGLVGVCGIAAMLLRDSRKHDDSEINIGIGSLLCVGAMRWVTNETNGQNYGFLDVLTCYEPHEERQRAKIEQAVAMAHAVRKFTHADAADPRGYVDDVPVLPFRAGDYVSRELQASPMFKPFRMADAP
jgi:hypothetical protein